MKLGYLALAGSVLVYAGTAQAQSFVNGGFEAGNASGWTVGGGSRTSELYNALAPSLTLSCGSYGHNSVSGNVSAINLVNIKRVARRNNNLQWFKVPAKTYFEPNAIRYLIDMPDVHRVTIVTDSTMTKLGFADRIIDVLMFRVAQLCVVRDVQTALVWATKILTDPFHDLMLYRSAPLALLRGELMDPGLHLVQEHTLGLISEPELSEQHA